MQSLQKGMSVLSKLDAARRANLTCSRWLRRDFRDYPNDPDDYELLEELGKGASATVRTRSVYRVQSRCRCRLCRRCHVMSSCFTVVQTSGSAKTQVYLAYSRTHNAEVALKIVNLDEASCNLVGICARPLPRCWDRAFSTTLTLEPPRGIVTCRM